MKCCSDCNQGRKPCPTPQSCELPQSSDDPARDITVVLLVIAFCFVALLAL